MTPLKSIKQYMEQLEKATNMKNLTRGVPETGVYCCNMYATSVFGEDVLANVCLELNDQTIQGHVRIRAKTQGIALSLGDKITMMISK